MARTPDLGPIPKGIIPIDRASRLATESAIPDQVDILLQLLPANIADALKLPAERMATALDGMRYDMALVRFKAGKATYATPGVVAMNSESVDSPAQLLQSARFSLLNGDVVHSPVARQRTAGGENYFLSRGSVYYEGGDDSRGRDRFEVIVESAGRRDLATSETEIGTGLYVGGVSGYYVAFLASAEIVMEANRAVGTEIAREQLRISGVGPER